MCSNSGIKFYMLFQIQGPNSCLFLFQGQICCKPIFQELTCSFTHLIAATETSILETYDSEMSEQQ